MRVSAIEWIVIGVVGIFRRIFCVGAEIRRCQFFRSVRHFVTQALEVKETSSAGRHSLSIQL
jgi:hypothetical protein